MPRTRTLLLPFIPRYSLWSIARVVLTLLVLRRLAICLSMKRDYHILVGAILPVDPLPLIGLARSFIGELVVDFEILVKRDIIRYRLRLMGVAITPISGEYRDYHYARGRYWGPFQVVTYVSPNFPGQRPPSHRYLVPWAYAQRYDEISHIRAKPWYMSVREDAKWSEIYHNHRRRNSPYASI